MELTPEIIGFALLGVCALAGGVFVFAGGQTTDRKTTKRVMAVAARSGAAKRTTASAADPADRRRKQVADSLKELDRKAAQAKARPSLRQRIEQAGLAWTVQKFWIISGALGFGTAVLTFIYMQNPLIALGFGAAMGLGMPRWILSFLTGRRQKKFLVEFANSIDVIVRGVKSGLPLNDCLKMIAQEAPDPVGGEFRMIIENQRVGLPLDECLRRFVERMPLAEVNFFQIVLAIQQKAGGNLSEALNNLSGVLRERKRLQGKIKALSSEAKSSAGIIGSLPPAILFLVYLSTPDYIKTLFTERMGNIMLACVAMWMGIGVLVMKKMISFRI